MGEKNTVAHTPGREETSRTYMTMAGKSIGKCSSGHWLPLTGDCDLCGAGPDEKCRYTAAIAKATGGAS